MAGVVQKIKPSALKRYFVGFSTQNAAATGVRVLYDIDLINVDLMNAFNTRVGERVMRPDYGCKLWDYVMEPMTAALREQIVTEAIRVCRLDTRTEVQNVQVFQFDVGFQISLLLAYLPWRVEATFTARFENADAVYFSGTALQSF